jgi:sporulation protein YlmC with PRC-barrel domain
MTKHAKDQHTQADLLVKLGDTNLTLSDFSDDIRGRKVLDSDGDEIGHVSALYIDKEESKIRFLQVGAGGFLGLGERQFLIPVEDVSRIAENAVHINHTREHVVKSPPYDPSLTTRRDSDYWNPYYGYYGYSPYWDGGF